MNNKIISSLVLAALLFLSACSEKFKIAAPYKTITVVYGLLDRADTAHYVRIQKAFLDDTKSALTMAQVSDSSLFSNITVKMEQLNMYDQSLFATFPMSRVDLNNEGYPKQTGVFFNSPNYAYKLKKTLDPNYIYRIVVTNNVTGEVDSADAPIIEDLDRTVFSVFSLDVDTNTIKPFLNFASTNINSTYDIQGQYNPSGSFNFGGNTTPVGTVEAFIRFQWYDSNGITGLKDTVEKYYDFDLGYNSITGNSYDFSVSDLSLYGAVSAGIGNPASTTTYRLLDRCKIMVYAGTYDFYDYLQMQSLQGLGLTGNEIEPTYTNIKGANALGLFTSRGLRSGLITISAATIDSLKSSPLTANVNIAGTIY